MRGELRGFDLLQVLMRVIAHLQDRKAAVLGEVQDVVVVGGLVGYLPFRGLCGIG